MNIIIGSIIVSIIFMYLLMVLLAYLFQDMILFHPLPLFWDPFEDRGKNNIESLNIRAKDNILLHGWFLKPSSSNSTNSTKKHPLIIYFGGNAEEVSYMSEYRDKVEPYALALINYRGYGYSQGKPSEKNLLQDSLTVYDYLKEHEEVDENYIVIMGRSLGTGVAVHLAYHRPTKGLILITPYDSIKNVAKEKFFFLPISLLLKHEFNSVEKAPYIKSPMLALLAENDTLIPLHHGRDLAKHWGGNYQLQVIPQKEHNTIDEGKGFWNYIDEFLKKL